MIKSHFFRLILSFRKNELKIIANGIESWAPKVIGANILETFKDTYKKKFTATPIDIEKPIKGRMYFFDGNFISQKGIKHKNTIPILSAPNKIGLTDEFNPNLPKGYALPKKNITKTINAVCLLDKTISLRKDLK